MTPYKHAQSSAAKWGGVPEDYVHIHDWFDETKQYTGDWTHRALRHHSAGVQWCIEKFGHALRLSNGMVVPMKIIAEQHVEEDCGFIPSPVDWLKHLKSATPTWMLRVGTKNITSKMEVKENGQK